MNGFGNSAGDWLIVVRAIHLAATAMLAGTLIFEVGIAKPALRPAPQAAYLFDKQALRMVWLCLLVSAASGAAWILVQAPAISGLSFGDAMASGVIGTIVTETQFGRVFEIRAVLAIVLAVCLASDRLAGARWLALVSALGLVGSIAWTGHAGSTAGELGILHLAADTLHVLAAAAWIGGLASLTVLLAVTLLRRADGWTSLVHDAVRRFSTLGIVSVATLLMSGIANASILVGSLHALLVTDYGRLLIVKITLFVAMLALAATNRFWLTPALADSSDSGREREAVRWLARTCIIELALGLVIFAVVGALGTIHPANHL
jgi:putative copper resistance protein D